MWPTFPLPSGKTPYRIIRYYYLTTPPYPVNAVEELASAMPQFSGAFGRDIVGDESFESAWSLIDGTLRDTLRQYTHPVPENFESSWTIVAGDIRDILRTYVHPVPENFESSWTLVNGSMADILITYNHPAPDSVESSWSLVSGTLT